MACSSPEERLLVQCALSHTDRTCCQVPQGGDSPPDKQRPVCPERPFVYAAQFIEYKSSALFMLSNKMTFCFQQIFFPSSHLSLLENTYVHFVAALPQNTNAKPLQKSTWVKCPHFYCKSLFSGKSVTWTSKVISDGNLAWWGGSDRLGKQIGLLVSIMGMCSRRGAPWLLYC